MTATTTAVTATITAMTATTTAVTATITAVTATVTAVTATITAVATATVTTALTLTSATATATATTTTGPAVTASAAGTANTTDSPTAATISETAAATAPPATCACVTDVDRESGQKRCDRRPDECGLDLVLVHGPLLRWVCRYNTAAPLARRHGRGLTFFEGKRVPRLCANAKVHPSLHAPRKIDLAPAIHECITRIPCQTIQAIDLYEKNT
ncbi:hypothetical protein [Pandoraea terrae]|uniref:hypothetical protein n=1 Tax=Pandoraea terrae TaxID=1537710 RepID=UPI00178399DF|nr:hypothetical protein [Pandoraea terrae]